MFDNNLRSLSKGVTFLAGVASCKPSSSLFDIGVRQGDVVFGVMLSIGSHNPRIKVITPSGTCTLNSWEINTDARLFDSRLTYLCQPKLPLTESNYLSAEEHVKGTDLLTVHADLFKGY